MTSYLDTTWDRMFMRGNPPSMVAIRDRVLEDTSGNVTEMIVGYRYLGRLIHGRCLLKMMCLPLLPAETVLDEEAHHEGFDRSDESTFTDRQFPHRVWWDPEVNDQPCGSCGSPLEEDPF